MHSIGRVAALLAFLLAALGFAFSTDADGRSGANEPTSIEFEGAGSESTSGDSLEESCATPSIRRLRPRDLERASRFDARPIEIASPAGPSPRVAARLAIGSSPGRDLLISQQRFLI